MNHNRANWAALLTSLAFVAACAILTVWLYSCCTGCNVERAAQSFGEQFKQWHPIDAETARALGEGIRPQVTVIDAESAAVLAAGVERGLTAIFAPKPAIDPPPGVPTSNEFWGGLGSLAALYGVNQVRKWLLSRKNGTNGGASP